jgi:hypothetical protein
MSLDFTVDKRSLDHYLNELAKELKRIYGRKIQPVEVVLVGGAAILINYDFRLSTNDVDAWLSSETLMTEAIRQVAQRYGLSNRWLNQDFVRTSSFSPKLRDMSVHYKTFQRILDVRTIQGADLIAMKLNANRHYKNDLSDVVGILMECEQHGKPLTLDTIETSVLTLYGEKKAILPETWEWLETIMKHGNYAQIRHHVASEEVKAQKVLLEAITDHQPLRTEEEAKEVLDRIRKARKG